MWRHRLRSRCEKKKNKNVNFGYHIEMGLVDQNDRYKRVRWG